MNGRGNDRRDDGRQKDAAAAEERALAATTSSSPSSPARGLADILREAGVPAAGRGGRRRRADDETDAADTAGPDPGDSLNRQTTFTNGSPSELPWSRTDTAPVLTDGWSSLSTGWPDEASARTSSRIDTAHDADTADNADNADTAATADTADSTVGPVDSGSTAAASHTTRSPSPVSTTPPPEADPEDAVAAPSAAIGWAILLVEVLAAFGLGVAVWYAFSALWDLLPYVAAFAGPLVVTGLVAVAGALRARTGRNPLGLPTLCILVFAGTVLVVLPAATLVVP